MIKVLFVAALSKCTVLYCFFVSIYILGFSLREAFKKERKKSVTNVTP